jgi:ABC-type transport system involved in cytochrome bd biosynthesis fused ATPase/permease subunit
MKISQIPIEFGHYVIRGALQAAGQFILILLTLSIILVYNIRLFSLLIFILLPPVLLVYYLVKRQIIQMRARSKDAGETMHRHLSEALRGYIESNVYGKKDYFSEKYIISQKVFNESLAQQQSIQTMPSRILEAFGFSAILLLMVLNQALYGSLLPLATAGVFVAAAYKILPAMVKLMTALSQMKTYRHSIPEIVRDTGERNSERIHFANTRIHSLECRNIYFKYKDQWVVENFSMKLQSGEMVCMSGVSGEGKTTVIHLLLGFLRPSKGVILLNEQIGKEPVFQLSSHVSYVQQSPFLINDTLAQNIVLGNEVDPVRLANILQITGLSDEWKLSGKTDTWKIKENGKDISGGQRQRIALARALYHDFDLLILDEPFSELDPASEIKLLRYLQHLAAEGKIILLITHNKESKSYCHKVVRLHESQEKSFNHFDSRVS